MALASCLPTFRIEKNVEMIPARGGLKGRLESEVYGQWYVIAVSPILEFFNLDRFETIQQGR